MSSSDHQTVRTRFAPSPTGFMHVGNLRTGLFAWLVARHYGGQFVLRLEDTDKNREVEGSAEHILECLTMLGLDWDEGIVGGGPYGPYRQSDRLDIYKKWAQRLIDDGRAYADPYRSEEVQAFREQAKANKQAFLYRNYRPSLELRATGSPEGETKDDDWYGKVPLRFKSDPKAYTWHDEVMGQLSTGPEVIDDFVLIKSDGYPTYNFAHIIDDMEMAITHVIRGQEFISSMPNYLNLYEALGFNMRQAVDAQPEPGGRALPVFATMPHIMNDQGNKKLGKRDGAKDVLDFIDEGFLPETLLGFIATLGWNDGSEQEVFTRDELIAKFSLDRIQRSGARFDDKRLLWMNGQFIRQLDLDDLSARVESYWPEAARSVDDDRRRQILALVQDRLKTLHDLPTLTEFFFTEPKVNWDLVSSNKQLKKLSRQEIKDLLRAAHDKLATTDWQADSIQDSLNQLLDETGHKPAMVFSIIRLAITWTPFSPQLNDTLALLGQQTSLARINQTIGQA